MGRTKPHAPLLCEEPAMSIAAAPAHGNFWFVDTAVGGVSNRNKVRDLRVWAPPAGVADVYTTWMRFDEDFAPFVAQNPSPKTGQPPSVAGYRGPGWAEFIPFDFD